MFDSARLVGFLLTHDYDRARAFYEARLKCTFVSQDQFGLVLRAGQNQIRIVRMPDFAPLQGTVLGWEVPDIHAAVRELAGNGVAFEKFPFAQDKDLGIWTAPNGDMVAWFKDPDGNLLGISQHV